jgi:hypothetical protein
VSGNVNTPINSGAGAQGIIILTYAPGGGGRRRVTCAIT